MAARLSECKLKPRQPFRVLLLKHLRACSGCGGAGGGDAAPNADAAAKAKADAAAKAKPDAAKAEIAKNRHDEAAMASKYIHELDLLFCAVEPVDDVPVLPQDPQLLVKVDDPAARPCTPPQPRGLSLIHI